MSTSNTNRKKVWIGILGIALVSLLAISITLAYLQSHTEDATNTFTLGDGVEIELEHDSTLHEDFTPGMEYDMPAKVKIPDTAMDWEYIAVKIDYYVEEQGPDGNLILKKIDDNKNFLDEYAKLQSYNVDGKDENTAGVAKQEGTRDGWFTTEDGNKNKIYYYGSNIGGTMQLTKVSSGSSITVFDQIKINDPYEHVYSIEKENPSLNTDVATMAGIAANSVSEIKKDQLETFHTVVTAYAVQGNISNEQALQEFDYLFRQSENSGT